MPKFYVQSGPVRLIFDAKSSHEAAIKAFQWSCDRQATIDAEDCLSHLLEAERRGWQLAEQIDVNERGFDRVDGERFETLDIVLAWQDLPAGCPGYADDNVA